MLYRIADDDPRGQFRTLEQALSRARELRKELGGDFDVLEIDDDGNETPVAHVATERTKLRGPNAPHSC